MTTTTAPATETITLTVTHVVDGRFTLRLLDIDNRIRFNRSMITADEVLAQLDAWGIAQGNSRIAAAAQHIDRTQHVVLRGGMPEGAERTYRAEFTRADHALSFVTALRADRAGFWATQIAWQPQRRTVTWVGPNTRGYAVDMAETVGFHGSPPRGPVAKLDGQDTPRSY